MEFKLKEGWFHYYVSGFFAGCFFLMVIVAYTLQGVTGTPIPWGYIFLLILLPLLSLIAFISGCMVKKAK